MAWRSRKQTENGAPAIVPVEPEASLDVSRDATAVANSSYDLFSAVLLRKVGAPESKGSTESSNVAILARARRIAAQAPKATIGTDNPLDPVAKSPASKEHAQRSESERQEKYSGVRIASTMLREVMTPAGLTAQSRSAALFDATLAKGTPPVSNSRSGEVGAVAPGQQRSGAFSDAKGAPTLLFPGRNCYLSGYRTASAPVVGSSLSMGLQARWESRMGREQMIPPDGLDGASSPVQASLGASRSGEAVIDLREVILQPVTPTRDTVISVRTGSRTSPSPGDDVDSDARELVPQGALSVDLAPSVGEIADDRTPVSLGGTKVFATVRNSAWIIDPLRSVGVMLAMPGSTFQLVQDRFSSTDAQEPGPFVEILLEDHVRLIPAWAFLPKGAHAESQTKSP